jgi:hypothetical protein
VLLAKENHEVVEPSPPDRRDGFAVELFGEIEPGNLSSERSSNWADFERFTDHRVKLPVRLTPYAARALS